MLIVEQWDKCCRFIPSVETSNLLVYEIGTNLIGERSLFENGGECSEI